MIIPSRTSGHRCRCLYKPAGVSREKHARQVQTTICRIGQSVAGSENPDVGEGPQASEDLRREAKQSEVYEAEAKADARGKTPRLSGAGGTPPESGRWTTTRHSSSKRRLRPTPTGATKRSRSRVKPMQNRTVTGTRLTLTESIVQPIHHDSIHYVASAHMAVLSGGVG
jgi:hypothetical protein